MLPPANRLRKKSDFAIALSGRKINSKSFQLFLHRSSENAPPKAGLIVAKSVGNSVVRHRVARKLRHAISPILRLLPEGSLLVARAFPQSAADISSTELRDEFEVAVKKALTWAELQNFRLLLLGDIKSGFHHLWSLAVSTTHPVPITHLPLFRNGE